MVCLQEFVETSYSTFDPYRDRISASTSTQSNDEHLAKVPKEASAPKKQHSPFTLFSSRRTTNNTPTSSQRRGKSSSREKAIRSEEGERTRRASSSSHRQNRERPPSGNPSSSSAVKWQTFVKARLSVGGHMRCAGVGACERAGVWRMASN